MSGADQPQRFSSVVRPDLRTGKLVRSVVVVSRPVNGQTVAETVIRPRVVSGAEPAFDSAPALAGIDETVERIAAEHALPAPLIHSVIKVESNYNPYAVSNKGALGIMQLVPETARRFGVANVFNPVENIRGGAKYLRYLLDLYGWNYPLALAAYNAGEAAVAKYGGIPPFAETQNYVILVGRQLEAAKRAAAAKAAVAAPKPVPPAPDGPAHIVEERQPDGSVHYVTR
ncbi:MAG TPA: lytic transglycosylase domain-containing protein [Candidatus Acidoferrales bacterium]|nr:lytic transglycosylase domain-containing protein [Candidatus Acidoferrales bacterium]